MTDIDITPEDFGDAYYGVHIFEDEDGNWFAYGHHSARRIAAAINAYARHNTGDLGDLTLDHIREGMVQAWGNNVGRDGDGIWWNPCESDAPGAFPFTDVRF